MKIREIILDFTSLLDIIMIILFFFILFSTLDVEKAGESAEEARISYEELKAENQRQQEDWQKKADEEWQRIQDTDKNAAANQQALIAYNEGSVIAFNLKDAQSSDIWTLSVLKGNKRLGEIKSDENLEDSLIMMLEKADLKTDDVIISTLTYDGNSFGTEKSVPQIERAVKKVQKQYRNLYFAEINVSR